MYEWRRLLKLYELLEELEHPDRILVPPDGVIFSLKTANDDVTDCDSGDEEFTTMTANLLRNDTEIIRNN
nr:unnamed protein product [Callosobruchus chinensis]